MIKGENIYLTTIRKSDIPEYLKYGSDVQDTIKKQLLVYGNVTLTQH